MKGLSYYFVDMRHCARFYSSTAKLQKNAVWDSDETRKELYYGTSYSG
eukprot:COSAG05_NODE_1055_length_6012_cov_4.772028_6_plen_48_part_00